MISPELHALRQEAKRQQDAQRTRMRQHYQLARKLGFSPAEAKALQGRREQYIRDLAKELPEGV